MLFIILGLSLIEIITTYILEKGVPFTTNSYKGNFFYDIKQNNTNKIINGTVHINYQTYILHPLNYFYMAETTGHDTISDNGFSKIFINFNKEENKTSELSFNFTFIPISPKSNAVRFKFDIKTFMIFNITITVNEI